MADEGEDYDDSGLAGMARETGGRSLEFGASREIAKQRLYGQRIERQNAWTANVLKNKTSGGISKPEDYFEAADKHRETHEQHDKGLKGGAKKYARAIAETKETGEGKREARDKRVKKYAGELGRTRSLSHGSIEQARHQGFKKALTTGIDGSKETKVKLRERAQKLSDEYRELNTHIDKQAARVRDKGKLSGIAVRALKHTDTDLDRRYSMVRLGAIGYMAQRGKTSKSLQAVVQNLQAAKKATKKTAEGAFFAGHLNSASAAGETQ